LLQSVRLADACSGTGGVSGEDTRDFPSSRITPFCFFPFPHPVC
jgi:hypothetical protein